MTFAEWKAQNVSSRTEAKDCKTLVTENKTTMPWHLFKKEPYIDMLHMVVLTDMCEMRN